MRHNNSFHLRGLLLAIAVLCVQMVFAQAGISGKVTNPAGAPLDGVAVTVENGRAHDVTNSDGSYQIQVPLGTKLIFTYIGYRQQEIVANTHTLNVVMQHGDTTNAGTDVVVTAFGIHRQERSLGYAVATVSAKDLTQAGATNVASALYGKAAGVKIVTPPGGATSAVSVQIRGVSSIGLNTQPLYVVDGVPIRLYNDLQGQFGSQANNSGYWSDTRIESNGILDINPDDIASMTVLKGAAAAALYGSEATNGVVIITTKKGTKGRGLGVDFNYNIDQEKVAYGPDYQNEYGPGYGSIISPQVGDTAGNANSDGWIISKTGVKHPYYGAYANFGPKFDGSTVEYWDGSMRPYNAQPDNWKQLYQTGFNSNLNVAVSNAGEAGSYRFSYTRTDYKSIMPGSNMNKNNFNFNGTLNLSKAVSIDLVSTYNYNFTHNRPYQLGYILGSYGGFFSRFDDMNVFKTRYQTTNGYKYVLEGNPKYDADQSFAFNPRATQLLDYFWTALRDIDNETQNRFINSVTLNIAFSNHVKFRARGGNDYTNWYMQNEQHNTMPINVGASGYYSVTSNSYNRIYGDALLTYTDKFTPDFNFTLMGGVSGRKDIYHNQISYTQTGLNVENFFTLSNSLGARETSTSDQYMTDIAAFGTLDLSYKTWLYLEGTGRYEGISVLAPGNNQFFYPSVSLGFVLSDLVKLPTFFNYAKLRASYAEVGNYPGIYQANVTFNQNTIPYNGSNVLLQATSPSGFGNQNLEVELKKEMEFGLETRMLNNKIGLDISYYNNQVYNQIVPSLSTAASSGATSQIMNAGKLSNYGVEVAINATPIANRDFRWTTNLNWSMDRNKLTWLPGETGQVDLQSLDNGYAIVRAKVGDPLGNVYTHPLATVTEGQYKGSNIISDGYYIANTNVYEKCGNLLAKMVGGWSNTITYKSFSFEFVIDYRFGGDLISTPTYYQIGAGMYKSTLQYRDAAHGGLSYNVVNGTVVPSPTGQYHDGVIIKGVVQNPDGSYSPNTTMIDATDYYMTTYDWGDPASDYSRAVFKNSYIKFREASLTYTMPSTWAHAIHFQKLALSIIGRNLFYIWKTLPHGLDPEVGVGSSWLAQGIDNGNPQPTRSLGISLNASF